MEYQVCGMRKFGSSFEIRRTKMYQSYNTPSGPSIFTAQFTTNKLVCIIVILLTQFCWTKWDWRSMVAG